MDKHDIDILFTIAYQSNFAFDVQFQPNELLGSAIIMTLRDNILYGKVRIGMIELVPEFFWS